MCGGVEAKCHLFQCYIRQILFEGSFILISFNNFLILAIIYLFIHLGAQPEIFREGENCWNKGTSINISSTTQKQVPKKKHSTFFLLDTLNTAFKMRNLTHRWTKLRFSSKIRAFFQFQERAGKTIPYPPSLVTSLYILISQKLLNNERIVR